MSDISRSILGEGEELSPELREKLETASPEEMKKLFSDELVRIGAARRDTYNPDILISVDQPIPKRFARSLTVSGQKLVFEADSELELERQVGNYFRETLGAQETSPARQAQPTDQSRNPQNGQFISSAAEAAQNAAVEAYLQSQGVDVARLREMTSAADTADWASAVEAFRQDHPNYAGTTAEGVQLIGETIANNPELFNMADRARAIEIAVSTLQEQGALPPNPEIQIHQRIADATTPEEIRDVLTNGRSSGFFGR